MANDPPEGNTSVSTSMKKLFQVNNGTCTTCDAKPTAMGVIECNSCGEKFHAACSKAEKSDKICTDTLLRNYSQNSTKKNFMWYCDPCLTIYEHNKQCGLEEKLNSLLAKFEIMVNVVTSAKDEISSNTKAISALVDQTKHAQGNRQSNSCASNVGDNVWKHTGESNVLKSLADTSLQQQQQAKRDREKRDAARRKKKANQASLIVKCDEKGTSPDLSQIRDVAINYGIPINQVNVTSNKNAVITLPDQETLDKLKPLLTAKPTLKQHDISNVKIKQPRITVANVDRRCAENFTDTLRVQNPTIAELIDGGETFEDVYFNKDSTSTTTVVHVTVSEKIRTFIKNRGNRVFLGLKSCRVYDKRNVNRCYDCHDYSHIANHCDKQACCGYCASDNHVSDDCPLKTDLVANKNKLLCINCKRENLDCVGHSVYWPHCPVYKRIIKNKNSLN